MTLLRFRLSQTLQLLFHKPQAGNARTGSSATENDVSNDRLLRHTLRPPYHFSNYQLACLDVPRITIIERGVGVAD